MACEVAHGRGSLSRQPPRMASGNDDGRSAMIQGHMRRMARILSVALITAGLVILADAGITLAWQEPLSSIYGSIKQSAAERPARSARVGLPRRPGGLGRRGPPSTKHVARQADQLASIYAGKIRDGQGIGRIKVPTVGIDFVLIQGTDEADLQKGPGHYPDTGLPGQGMTIGIAGHRTTYLAPFRDIARHRGRRRGDPRDPLRHVHLQGREDGHRRPDRDVTRRRCRLRAGRPHRLPSALQRRPALRRHREAGDMQLTPATR